MFKNFNYDQLNVKRMFKGLKWQVVKSLINQDLTHVQDLTDVNKEIPTDSSYHIQQSIL